MSLDDADITTSAPETSSAPGVRNLALTDDERTGQLIRSRRKIRRMSLQQMADEIGVATGLLSQIERGISSPSLQTLKKICVALEMPFPWLFVENDAARDSDIIVRKADRRRLVFNNIGMSKELLNNDEPSALQLVIMTIEVDGTSAEQASEREGEKTGLILRGKIDLNYADRVITLEAGDSFRFRSDTPHLWKNRYDEKVEIVMAVNPPFY